MLPRLSVNHCLNGIGRELIDTDYAFQGMIDSIVLSYYSYDRFRKYRHSAGLASGSPVTEIPIRDIIRLRSRQQMFRPDARRVVAAMANNFSLRDWAVMQFVTNTMRVNLSPILPQKAIAVFIQTALPSPVLRSFSYRCPESFYVVGLAMLVRARLGAMFRVTRTHLIERTIKRLATKTTVAYYGSSQDLNLPYRSVLRSGSFIASTVGEPIYFSTNV